MLRRSSGIRGCRERRRSTICSFSALSFMERRASIEQERYIRVSNYPLNEYLHLNLTINLKLYTPLRFILLLQPSYAKSLFLSLEREREGITNGKKNWQFWEEFDRSPTLPRETRNGRWPVRARCTDTLAVSFILSWTVFLKATVRHGPGG